MDQHVEAEAMQTEGGVGADLGGIGVGHFLGIHKGNGALTNDANATVRLKHGTGVLINPQPKEIWVGGNRAQ